MTKRSGYNQAVYYISRLASNQFGRHRNQYFTFDEASKIDLKDTNVIVLDVHQLQTRYRQRHPEGSDEKLEMMTAYELAEDLIDTDPMASYFFDECPFIASDSNGEDSTFRIGKIMDRIIVKRLITGVRFL